MYIPICFASRRSDKTTNKKKHKGQELDRYMSTSFVERIPRLPAGWSMVGSMNKLCPETLEVRIDMTKVAEENNNTFKPSMLVLETPVREGKKR